MGYSLQTAKHFHDVYFGGNWSVSNLREAVKDVTVEEATTRLDSLNSILMLVYHINYYVRAVTLVLEGGKLDAHDKYSFEHPVIDSEDSWQNFLSGLFSDGERFADLVKQLPDEKLLEIFEQEKYGSYFRNLHGIIEHTHYHLGQIVVIKKLLRSRNPV